MNFAVLYCESISMLIICSYSSNWCLQASSVPIPDEKAQQPNESTPKQPPAAPIAQPQLTVSPRPSVSKPLPPVAQPPLPTPKTLPPPPQQSLKNEGREQQQQEGPSSQSSAGASWTFMRWCFIFTFLWIAYYILKKLFLGVMLN